MLVFIKRPESLAGYVDVEMEAIPRVGDSISLSDPGDKDTLWRVEHVKWVPQEGIVWITTR